MYHVIQLSIKRKWERGIGLFRHLGANGTNMLRKRDLINFEDKQHNFGLSFQIGGII